MIVCILYWAFHIIFVVITIDVHTSSLKPHKLFRCKHRGKRKGWQAEHWWLKPEVSSVRLPVPTSLFISYFCFKFLYFQHEARCSVHNICQLLSHVRLSIAQYYNWSDYTMTATLHVCWCSPSLPPSPNICFMSHVWLMN